MPTWIYVPNPTGKTQGLMGPYTRFRAQRVADKLEVEHMVVDTVSSDPVRAKRELKRKIIEESGYAEGSRRIHKPVQREVA